VPSRGTKRLCEKRKKRKREIPTREIGFKNCMIFKMTKEIRKRFFPYLVEIQEDKNFVQAANCGVGVEYFRPAVFECSETVTRTVLSGRSGVFAPWQNS